MLCEYVGQILVLSLILLVMCKYYFNQLKKVIVDSELLSLLLVQLYFLYSYTISEMVNAFSLKKNTIKVI